MSQDALLATIDAAYDAAAGGTAWAVVGERASAMIGAAAATLMVYDPTSGARDLLWRAVPDEGIAAYERHYHKLDFYTARAAAWALRQPADQPPRALLGGMMLVPDAELLRSEFYVDFCRPYGLRHIIGTAVPLGAAGVMPIGLHRPANRPPFGDDERRLLDAALPHLRRALQLRHRLAGRATGGFAALEALPIGAMVVGAGGEVRYANPAAERLAAPGSGLLLRRVEASGGRIVATRAVARHAVDANRFAVLIHNAATGGAGGAVALRDAAGGAVAALVSPLPARLGADPDRDGRRGGEALVLLRPIGAPPPPPSVEVLRGLFGLSVAEAAVARALVGGASKAAVAAARGLRETTVRTQVRAVLAKTGAANLRDLERLLAGLHGL